MNNNKYNIIIMDCLTSIYAIVFAMGVLGNGGLGLSLCCGPGAKKRSPLLFGLIIADLSVCCLSGPITASMYMIAWTENWWLFALFIQAWPASASTLSMMAISIDRYLTVKNYTPTGQVSRRRHLLTTVVIVIWIFGGILSATNLISSSKHHSNHNHNIHNNNNNNNTHHYFSSWERSLIFARIFILFIIPSVVVLVSHFGVHAKLTALSLTARAKHGELPLPMPLLRRPSHVIIVAGITKSRDNLETKHEDNDDDDDDVANQPPTSTLRSRRRLANSFLSLAFVFALSWLPFIVCQLCYGFNIDISEQYQKYSLLIGHCHSAISPILYWSLNHQWPKRPCCFRLPAMYRSASSTNEAALGPFNPKLVRPPPIRRRSSHYLY